MADKRNHNHDDEHEEQDEHEETNEHEEQEEQEEAAEEVAEEPQEHRKPYEPTADQRRVAKITFDKARSVIATEDYDYAISLLKTCCKIDPGNVQYRQVLRKTQKEKYGNNMRGSRFAFFSTPGIKAKMKTMKASGNYAKVLEFGEDVLSKNPWDLGTQMDMAEAFDAMGFLDLAVFTLDQARQKYQDDSTLNRALARLFEKRGDFSKAIVLWQLVQRANPKDVEAAHKAKDLSASETIQRGNYQKVADSGNANPSPAVARMEASGHQQQDRVLGVFGVLFERIEADPSEPSLYIQLSTLYRRHKQEDRARAVLQQGLGPTGNNKIKHTLEHTELDLIPMRQKVEELESKIRVLRAGGETDDDSGEQALIKARAKLVNDITTQELQIFRTRAERLTNDLSHRLEYGIRLIKANRIDDAIIELQQAKREEKCKGKASMYLGVCFQSKKNWRLAQRNWEEALTSLDGKDEASRKEVLYQLAVGSAEHGDLARAIDLGNELSNLDFTYKNINELVDGWQARVSEA